MQKIYSLINLISTLPSLGNRSATRITLKMLENKDSLMYHFSTLLKDVADSIKRCQNCNNFDENLLCNICTDRNRDINKLCILDTVADLWQLEKSQSYNGIYYIFSIDNIFLDEALLNNKIESLFKYINKLENLHEIIFAFNLDVKTQTFTNYLYDILIDFKIKNNYQFKITTLAKGIPVGSFIEYMDESTITVAINQRKEY